MEKGGKFEMKEERFLKLTYIHDIATIVSIFLSVFHVMKGTGSKIRDVLCGSFLVMQIFAALKIGARFLEKKNDLQKSMEELYHRSEKEWGAGWKSSLLLYVLISVTVFFKVGVPLLLGKDNEKEGGV